jgi:hypothetical protein
MAISSRAYAAAHFALELDNVKGPVGLFRSIEGGGVKADVMTNQFAANEQTGYQRYRQLGKPKFEDIKLQVGMAMSQPFYEWMTEFFAGKGTRKNGAIVAADFYYVERARRTFTEALIKEVTLPKLDASDKNAVYLTLALAVEDIAFEKGNGQKLEPPKGFAAQKNWAACNFRFALDGYDDACRRVTKVDSFTVKQNIAEYHMGGRKAPLKTPTVVEYPNLTFYVPEADAQPFMDAMATSVGFGGKGNGTVRKPAEKNGYIEAYDMDNRTLFYVDFFGSEIVSVTPDRSDSTSEEIKMVKVELYTERMEFTYPIMELE